MNSMTGYGKAVVTKQGRELCVELKSVNHRFLDISTKIPRMFISCEDIIRNRFVRRAKQRSCGCLPQLHRHRRRGKDDRCGLRFGGRLH